MSAFPWRSFPCIFMVLASSGWLYAKPRDAVRLSWDAPEGCPGANAILARIDELLGAHEHVGEPVRVRATVTDGVDGYQLEIATEQGASEQRRALSASSCGELAEAASVVIALVVAPGADLQSASSADAGAGGPRADGAPGATPAAQGAASSGSPRGRPRQPVVPKKAASAQSASRVDPVQSAPPARESPELAERVWLVAAAAEGDIGSLPKPSLGVRLGAGVRVGAELSWEVRLSGTAFQQSKVTTIPNLPGASADFRLLAGALAGCRLVRSRGLDFDGCLTWEVGQLKGAGHDTDSDLTRSSLWLAPGADLGVGPWFGPFSLGLRAALVVPLYRPKFTIHGLKDPVHRSAPVAGRLALTGRLRF